MAKRMIAVGMTVALCLFFASIASAASAKWAAADSTLNVCTATGSGTLSSTASIKLFNLTCSVTGTGTTSGSSGTPAEAVMDGPNWVVITPLTMHLSTAQSLFVTSSLVTGLYTETQIKGGGGSQSASATAKVLLRVVDVTGCTLNNLTVCGTEKPAEPVVDCTPATFGCDSADANTTFGVAFDERIQALTATLNLGESIDLALATATGHSYGFGFDDMTAGTHNVVVEVAVEASTTDTSATYSGALSAAAFGLGFTTAEAVNLTQGSNDMDF
jgi:hypothetical protein